MDSLLTPKLDFVFKSGFKNIISRDVLVKQVAAASVNNRYFIRIWDEIKDEYWKAKQP